MGQSKDIEDMKRVIGSLLVMIDDLMEPDDGGVSMHAYGQTPAWFVEAAFLSTYGTLDRGKPNDQ